MPAAAKLTAAGLVLYTVTNKQQYTRNRKERGLTKNATVSVSTYMFAKLCGCKERGEVGHYCKVNGNRFSLCNSAWRAN